MATITIYDVAQEAKCSTATVSLVLQKSPRIKPQTQQRVMQAVDKLGYTPNYMAQSLSIKATKTLGLIVPNIENPLFSQMIHGVEDFAVSKDYDLILGISDSSCEKEEFFLDMLQSKKVDGLLLFPTFLDSLSEKLRKINATKTPLVLCGSSGKGIIEIDYVKCDNRIGSFTAINHLIDIGCKNIGCIFPVFDKQQYNSRLIGFQDALYYHSMKFESDMIKTCIPNKDAIYNATVEFIKEKNPDGIFCLYDYASIPVMKAILSLGLKIPNDIALIGYDNIQISDYLPISLSSIDTQGAEVGRKAAEILIQKINDTSLDTHQIILKPNLVIRESTSR